jgi:hypothetical protein
MTYEFATVMMLMGMFASCVYFAVGLYEQMSLQKIPAQSRPRWIPRVRFQKTLGHLAIVSAFGYAVACVVVERVGGKTGIFALLFSVWFLAQAHKHFTRAKCTPTTVKS